MVLHRTQSGGDVAMSKNHGLELIGRGINGDAKQDGIEGFMGPGTRVQR
jgi:hypothetical protein